MNRSKRRFRPRAAVVLVLVMLLVVTAESISAHTSGGYSHDSDIGANNADWMAALPDSVRVSEMSLPGTHDTMADETVACGIVEGSVLTQSMDLPTQLKSGIRVLDIRLRHIENVFAIHHGACFVNTFFGNVLQASVNFLAAHPDEVVFMAVQKANVAEGTNTRTFQETFDAYINDPAYSAYIWQVPSTLPCGSPTPSCNPHNPMLGDVRGKIVFIQNFWEGTIVGIAGPFLTGVPSYIQWSRQNDYEIPGFHDLYTKWVAIRDLLDVADIGSAANQDIFYLNFLSGVGWPDTPPWFVASGHVSPDTGAARKDTGFTTESIKDLTKGKNNENWKDFPTEDCIWAGDCIFYEGTNVLTMNYINNRNVTSRVGIILADFPGAGLISAIIDLNNLRPRADAGGPYTEDEGSPILFDASGSSDPDGDILQYRWDFENDGTWDTEWSTTPTATHTFYDDFVGNARVEVSDGKFTDEAIGQVTVNNVDPSITLASVDAPGFGIDEGGSVALNFRFVDPGTEDTFTVVIDWGDGDTTTIDDSEADMIYSEEHQYLDDRPGSEPDGYFIILTVTDDNSGVGTATRTVKVNNVAPVITASGDEINENGIATVSGDITDPGTQDAFTVEINWGDGITETYNYGVGAVGYSETHQYLDDRPGSEPDVYPVSVMITDDDGGEGIASTTVAVNNVAPVASIDHITDEAGNEIGVDVPVALVGVTLDVVGSFTDVGTLDTHTASLNWGDGMVDDATGTIAGSHIYTAPDTYTIELTVTDDDAGQGVQTASVTIVDASAAITTLLDQLSGFGGNPYIARAYDFLAGTNGSNDDNGALAELSKGNLNAAMVKIKQAMEELEAAEADDPTLDLTIAKSLLALTAKSIAVDTLGQAEAAAKNPADEKKVDKAAELVAEGNDLLGAQDYLGAVESYLEAVREASPVF